MDGDLQHPPEIIPELLAEAAMGDYDVVVASRYTGPGEAAGLSSPFRRVVSSAATGAAKVFFPRRLSAVSDPMSGFFILRRQAVDSASLRPRGFKILLEIVARTPQLRVSEVPFTFAERHEGESKASGREMIRYLRQLTALKWAASKAQVSRFAKFALVGGSGVAVNLAALHFLLAAHGVGNAVAASLATQIAICWNFLLTELWVFGRRRSGRIWARAAAFWAINTAALAIQLPLADLIDRFTPLDYVRATLVALALLVVVRFVVCELVLYPTIGRSRTRQSSAAQPAGTV
jgi:dolichol-phosphate mannosyltransferase